MKKLLFLLAMLAATTGFVKAAPGDTLVVQTFTFGSPQNATFVFPSDTSRFEKIMMYYTLKCNPSQNPKCGEWDYTTRTWLYDHTGTYDSTLSLAPYFTVDGNTLDSLLFNLDTTWSYFCDTLNQVTDSVPATSMQIMIYGDSLNPYTPTDSIIVWPGGYYNYLFDPLCNIIDSVFVPADSLWHISYHNVYTLYEVLDKYELGRYITPYGIGLDLGEGWMWKFDVSDYKPLLHDSVHLSAGNWQELLDLKFIMIEGTPPRDVLKVEKMWSGNFGLSNFVNTVLPMVMNLDPSASMFRLKTRASGHGWNNPTNCAEFCPKIHSVDVDGNTEFSWQIITECGRKPLYPQGGTWIYDRAGWCPGDIVVTQDLELTPFVTPGSSVTLDYNSVSDNSGNYLLESFLISYSGANFSLDAAIDEIVAPNNWELMNRFNPICNNPIVVIKNTGSTTLTSLNIEFGPQGGYKMNQQWTGSLAFLETEEVELTSTGWQLFDSPDTTIFEVTASNPNNGQDEYAFNNTMRSTYDTPPKYDSIFVIDLRTNNVGSETSYELLDDQGTIIFSKSGLANNTQYKDTMELLPGCYTFHLYDSDCDGLSFFANNDGNGSCIFRKANGTPVVIKSLERNFGCQISQRFTIGYTVSTPEYFAETDIDIYPNPNSGEFTISLSFPTNQEASVTVYSVLGEIIFHEELGTTRGSTIPINVTDHGAGVYMVKVKTESGTSIKRVVVAE